MLIKNRTEIMDELNKKKIGTQMHYLPVYNHPYYKELGYYSKDCPNAETYYNMALSIPMYALMDNEDVCMVISAVKEVLNV